MEALIIANTVLVQGGISGGDIVLPYINKYWLGKMPVTVMTTTQGKAVWDSISPAKEYILLPHGKYEEREWKWTFFFTYVRRCVHALRLLPRVLKGKPARLLVFSASDFFPDVIPAFWARGRNKIFWIARVFHLITSPFKRKGNIFFNLASFLLQRISLRLIASRADVILTPVGTYKELCNLGIEKEKIFISNPGIDLAVIDNVVPDRSISEAIFIGALLFNKGSYDLVKIWKKVVNKMHSAKLIIIGGGPKREVEAFQKAVDESGIKSSIEYLGFMKDIRQVYARLKSSKILILTGHENGWSIPVSEAFACGRPVVAYQLKMFGTAFKKGFLTVPLHEIDLFADTIIAILSDENKRKELSQQAYAEGRALGWDSVAGSLQAYIERVISINHG